MIGTVVTMTKAVVAAAFGGPDVLKVIDRDPGEPGPGQVLIDVRAIGTNPIDIKTYSGAFGADPDKLPIALGNEIAGVIAAVGTDAEGITGPLTVGDEVLAYRVAGGYAQQVITAASNVLAKPSQLSFEQAAGLLLTGATAIHLLETTHVFAGETVLIHGGGGGVGLPAIQLVRLRGATVIATASRRRHDSLRELGAIPVDYGPGLADRVRAATPDGVDVALDTVGTDEAIATSLELVADQSRIATIAGFGKTDGTGIKLLGGGPGADPGTAIRNAARAELVGLAGEGKLTVTVDRTFPLEEADAAHRYVIDGHATGKVILLP